MAERGRYERTPHGIREAIPAMTAERQKLEQLAQGKLELEQQRDRHSRDSRQCNDALLNAMQAHAKLQQKLDSSGMEESQILEKLWERYELSHSDAMEQRIELESVPKATRCGLTEPHPGHSRYRIVQQPLPLHCTAAQWQ